MIEGTRACARAVEDSAVNDLGRDFGFGFPTKTVFGERGERGRLRGASPLLGYRIAGWAFDAVTDKRGGNQFK
jgi:hypothetical protein